MTRQGSKRAFWIGIAGASLLVSAANAMTPQDCTRLTNDQYLAAIELGTCQIDLQTAAGPDQVSPPKGNRDGRNGGPGGGNGGNGGDGGNNGGSNPGRNSPGVAGN